MSIPTPLQTLIRFGKQLPLALPLVALLLQGCEQTPLLDRLQGRGRLHIATVTGPLSCYLGKKSAAGLEYELARAFAKSQGLQPVFTVYPNRRAAIQAVKAGKEDMAAAFILPSARQKALTYLSISWLDTTPVFAHTMGWRAFDPGHPGNTEIVTTADSYLAELLARKDLPGNPLNKLSEEHILASVAAGDHNHVLSTAAQLKAHANLLPSLVPGVSLEENASVHWLFNLSFDDSLRDAANRFLAAWKHSGRLQKLREKYIDRLPQRNYVTRRDFWKHVNERLPDYQETFRRAGKTTGIDWRLLAAIGYQESHWNPKAASPTGVRGIMMLTKATAKQQSINDRLDPVQSIIGGARHLRWMEKRIPERIQGEDLLWFTLASYNIGYGHLEDARILTERDNADPDSWEEVKQRLPLLSQKQYYSTLKHGRARGREPVIYVENIRYYYRLLVYWDNARNGRNCATNQIQRRLALKN
ncbi:MAG TPA: membrane-bound lytic murein transglycosylase MltF [Chromatiaceae bacterium]|nr:membrane-bound lytic murein transglycosylase MltF [Chromatiaceae bacterium]